MKYTVDMIEKAKALRAEGWSYARIAEDLGGSYNSIRLYLNPAARDARNRHARERLQDPINREEQNRRCREYDAAFRKTYGIGVAAARRAAIPGAREECNRRVRERRQDPIAREEYNKRFREWLQDPINREKQREYARKSRAKRKAEKEKQNAS